MCVCVCVWGIFWFVNSHSNTRVSLDWFIHPSIVVVVDTLRHASSNTTHNMSDERTYIMIKYVHVCATTTTTRTMCSPVSLSLNTSRRRRTTHQTTTI